MRRAWPLVLVCAAALPARSDRSVLSTGATTRPGTTYALSMIDIEALTPVDATPDLTAIDSLFRDGGGAMLNLIAAATDPQGDVGVAIRAIRTLPAYCANQLDPSVSEACATNSEPHDTLAGVVTTYRDDHSMAGLMKLRSAIEAIGLTRSSDPNDVALLEPLTQHDSRDIRAAAATALGNVCNTSAQSWLQQRVSQEQSLQVQASLAIAIRKLQACGLGSDSP
ncbi:MAG TPA: HEAT repeat domain-containing protein [Kofleriaceae bacterium]